MSHEVGSEVDIGAIKASTYGVLFFGVPEHAETSFGKLAAVASHGESGAVATPLMQALRRDLLWQQESNAVYSQICNQFTTRYFTESSSEMAAEHARVCTTIVISIVPMNLKRE